MRAVCGAPLPRPLGIVAETRPSGDVFRSLCPAVSIAVRRVGPGRTHQRTCCRHDRIVRGFSRRPGAALPGDAPGLGRGPQSQAPGALNSVPSPGRTWRVALVACGGLVGVAVACLRCGAAVRWGCGRTPAGGWGCGWTPAAQGCGVVGVRVAPSEGGWCGAAAGVDVLGLARVRVHEAQGADAPAAAGAHPHPPPPAAGDYADRGGGAGIRQPRTRARTAAATCRQPRARGRVTAATCRPARAFVPPRAARVGAAPPGRRGAPAPPARTNAGAWCPANYGHSGRRGVPRLSPRQGRRARAWRGARLMPAAGTRVAGVMGVPPEAPAGSARPRLEAPLPAERPHPHRVPQPRRLRPPRLHPVPQRPRLRQFPQEPCSPPPTLGLPVHLAPARVPGNPGRRIPAVLLLRHCFITPVRPSHLPPTGRFDASERVTGAPSPAPHRDARPSASRLGVDAMRLHVVDHPWSPTSSPRCATSAPTPRPSAVSPTSWSPCSPTRPRATCAPNRSTSRHRWRRPRA